MMYLSSLASIILLYCLIKTVSTESIELRPDNIKQHISSGTWLIEHFSPWCPHCQNFAPHWKKATEDLQALAAEHDFHFGTIDCSTQGDLCDEHDVMAYPTIQLWEQGEKIERYMGKADYDPVVEYVNAKIEAKKVVQMEDEKEEALEQAVINEEPDIEEEEEEEEEEELSEQEKEEEEVVAALALPNPEGLSVNLDGPQLKEIAAGNTPWFIKFYAPWCGHCKALAPTWTEMASQLQGQVHVGEVNCQSLPDVCQEYGVKGFPTLEMLGNGEPVLFHSDRSLASLMAFALSHSGPAVKKVDFNELIQHLAVKDVAVIYLFNKEKADIPTTIETIANQYASTLSFYASSDEACFKKFSVSPSDLPVILIAKDNMYHIYGSHDFSNTKSAQEALIHWIEEEQYPLITKLGPQNGMQVLQGHVPVVINLFDAEDKTSQSKFRMLASAWNKQQHETKVIFAEMDRSMWKDYVASKFNIQHETSPKIFLYQDYVYFEKDVHGQVFSLDDAQSIYDALNHLDQLQGQSTLAMHQKLGVSVSHGLTWMSTHWLFSLFSLSILSGLLYRYLTHHRPKGASILPSFRQTDHHKD